MTSYRLSELIESVSKDLKAAKKADIKDATMLFSKCEIELAVSVTDVTGGGLQFGVVGLGAKVSAEEVSRIKLTFDANPSNALGYRVQRKGAGPEPRQRKGEQGD